MKRKIFLLFFPICFSIFTNTIGEQLKKIPSNIMEKEIPKIQNEFGVSIYAINLTEKRVHDYPEFGGGGIPAKIKNLYNQIQEGGNPAVSIPGYSSLKITKSGQTFLIIYPKEKEKPQEQNLSIIVQSNVKDYNIKINGLATKMVKGNTFSEKISSDKLPLSYTVFKEGYQTITGKFAKNKTNISIKLIALSKSDLKEIVDKPSSQKNVTEKITFKSNEKGYKLVVEGVSEDIITEIHFSKEIELSKLPLKYTVIKEGFETIAGEITKENKENISLDFIKIEQKKLTTEEKSKVNLVKETNVSERKKSFPYIYLLSSFIFVIGIMAFKNSKKNAKQNNNSIDSKAIEEIVKETLKTTTFSIEEDRKIEEQRRIRAEEDRKTEEQRRIKAEEDRKVEEQRRIKAEEDRKTEEIKRKEAELREQHIIEELKKQKEEKEKLIKQAELTLLQSKKEKEKLEKEYQENINLSKEEINKLEDANIEIIVQLENTIKLINENMKDICTSINDIKDGEEKEKLYKSHSEEEERYNNLKIELEHLKTNTLAFKKLEEEKNNFVKELYKGLSGQLFSELVQAELSFVVSEKSGLFWNTTYLNYARTVELELRNSLNTTGTLGNLFSQLKVRESGKLFYNKCDSLDILKYRNLASHESFDKKEMRRQTLKIRNFLIEEKGLALLGKIKK